ncbi:Acetyltransferase (GNAT) family protein [Amycolatopsis pretoriensis]|uniref:Acetyltransferase (GNAT) family protein n=1 Tax=Amycolatopsis pretoriensis TaxID=218821 RepID=A0A1H5Q6P9_9PSEU|nr:GNAT family N-acetyltransferase [Amycolatopsis pretoriensis]SEF21782.1 Acetyltransferase (GNAT) family protein [Amycolatopsis pretoriensis]
MTVSVDVTEDVPALVASAAALFAEDAGSHDPRMDLGWPDREGAPYYQDLVADDEALCLLAHADGVAAGHLIGRLLPVSPLRPDAVRAVLESMRVAAECRRRGVGEALVSAFVSWARKRGANELAVQAYAANEGALAFYRAQGFRPFEVRLAREA